MVKTSEKNARLSTIATLVANVRASVDRMDARGGRRLLEDAGYWPPENCDDPRILLAQGLVLSHLPNGLAEAKDRLAKSARLFKDDPQAVESQIQLAFVYKQSGEVQEARALLDTIDPPEEYRFCYYIVSGLARSNAEQSLALYEVAEKFVPQQSLAIQAKYHSRRAATLRAVADSKERKKRSKDLVAVKELRERSELEYVAALTLARDAEANDLIVVSLVNLAGLYSASKRYKEAKALIDDAVKGFSDPADTPYLGKTLDQRAVNFLKWGKVENAVLAARQAVATLERTDRENWTAEALTTLATSLARNKEYGEARSTFERAAAIYERLGDRAETNMIYAAMIEHLPLSWEDAFLLFTRIDHNYRIAGIPALQYRIEAEAIRLALEQANGSIEKAAVILSLTRHGLEKKLDKKFSQFLTKPKRARRKSVLSSPHN